MQILHQYATRRERHVFTAFVFGLWLLYYLLHPLEDLSVLPAGLYDPVGALRWLPPWMAEVIKQRSFLLLVREILLVLCLACMIPPMFGWCAPLCCLLITFEQSYVRSFAAQINHAELNLMFAAYLLTAFHFCDLFLPKATKNRGDPGKPTVDGIPLFSVALVLCLTYYCVGVSRLYYGGAYMFSGDTIIHFILDYNLQPSFFDFAVGDPMVRSSPMVFGIKTGFVLMNVLEVLAPLCLVSRNFRRVFVCGMIASHLGIYVTMKISFHENVLLMCAVLSDSGPSSWLNKILRCFRSPDKVISTAS